MTKEQCLQAAEIISQCIFASNEYTPFYAASDAIKLLNKLIEEHFELVDHTTPKKVVWIFADEPLCPSCSEAIDAGDQDLCEFCGQRLDWSE